MQADKSAEKWGAKGRKEVRTAAREVNFSA